MFSRVGLKGSRFDNALVETPCNNPEPTISLLWRRLTWFSSLTESWYLHLGLADLISRKTCHESVNSDLSVCDVMHTRVKIYTGKIPVR